MLHRTTPSHVNKLGSIQDLRTKGCWFESPAWAFNLPGIIPVSTKDVFFPKQQILDSSKLEEFADDNSKFDENGRKRCGKRRNCSLQAISPFSTVFKRLVLQTHKNQGLFGKGLKMIMWKSSQWITHYHTIQHFDVLKI